jgi:hypothetical protein
MGWFIFSVFAVAATFTVTFYSSGDIWGAMFAAAIPVGLFLVGLLLRATRYNVTRRQRILILSAAVVVLLGVAGHWTVMHSMARHQYTIIMGIHERIERNTMMSAMYDRATPVFASFHSQHFPENRSMTEVFGEHYPALTDRGPAVLLDSLDSGVKVYAKSAWNTTIVLTAVGGIGRGIDPEYRNVDGRQGFLQASLRLTPEGMVYESQN